MCDSGIKCSSELEEILQDMEMKTRKYGAVIAGIKKVGGKQQVVCIEKIDADPTKKYGKAYFEAFVERLKEAKIGYGLCILKHKAQDGRETSERLPFIFYNGPDGKVGEKMVCSSTKGTVTKKVKSITSQHQADDDEELSWKTIVEKESKGNCMFTDDD